MKKVNIKKMGKLRKTKIAFVIGVILIILGIVLVFAVPASVTWKPKSEVLADEKSLPVAPRWNSTSEVVADEELVSTKALWLSKSEVLADEETLSTSPLWSSESEELTDEVLTVSTWSTYDYDWVFPPYIYEDAKDFVIEGTAVEQSSPLRWFNFYVFDDVNFDLWKTGKSYEAYYEDTQGKTSLSFSFSIATKDDLPDWFYFVVEEHIIGVKPTVRVTATISWVEKSSRFDHTEYYYSYGIFVFEEIKDVTLNGTVEETGTNQFNFYVMDSSNYGNWYDEKAYSAYYQAENITTASFSIPLTKDQATSSIYFAVENPNLDINETVKLSASLYWIEKTSRSEYTDYHAILGIPSLILEEVKDITVNGTATEVGHKKFNFYVMDDSNYYDWLDNKPYNAYYEVKDVLTTTFSVSLTKDEASSWIYFVVENLFDTNETVTLSSRAYWIEKTPFHLCSKDFSTWEFIIFWEKTRDYMLKGNATEVGNHEFDFYILDSDNYFDWKADKPYTAFYEKTGVTSTSFNVSLTEDQAESIFYFVVENPLTDIEETVKVSADLNYQEKATVAGAVAGLILGGIVGFIGFIVLIISAVAHFIFKPESKHSM